MTSSAASFSLSALLGIPAGMGCLLQLEQVRALTALLLRNRPADLQACCFLGGITSDVHRYNDDVVMLADAFGLAPYLVLSGSQGAIALLTWDEGGQYRTRLICDPELVDRAALVLAQLSNHSYTLRSLVEPEVQQVFIARFATALVAELPLSAIAYNALMPDDQLWPALAIALATRSDPETLMALPELRHLLQDLSVQRMMLGQLDADQRQLTLLAAMGGPAPQRFLVQRGVAANVILRGRPGSAISAAASGLVGSGDWADGAVLTIVPLIRDERAWGLLLATSPRPLHVSALSSLAGLGALLALHPGVTPPPPLPANSSAQTNSILQPARSLGAGLPTVGASTRGTPRASSPGYNFGAILAQLGDAILLVDAQGRVAAYTEALARLLGISTDARGLPLVASSGACLAPLLSEALMDEPVEAREIDLPTGRRAAVSVVAFVNGLWAFVLREAATSTVPRSQSVAQPAPGAVGVCNESFLANFANILRVPLRELRELIMRLPMAGELNEQQSYLVGQTVKLNSDLTMLVNDLIALGQIRLDAGEQRSPLRLDLLIDAAVGTQYAEFERRGQQVSTDLSSDLPRVYGSEEGLGRAIAALIDNAIKYSAPGARIQVRAYQAGDDVVVAVEDTGPGLPSDELDRVFDPFYRAESTAQLGIAGRGLGLAITRAVIEHHDGRIWAVSTPGIGSTFAFSLPVADAP